MLNKLDSQTMKLSQTLSQKQKVIQVLAPQSASKQSGLIFPVSRVTRLMRKSRLSDRISKSSCVALTSILQYFTHELISLAGDMCFSSGKVRITDRHLVLAISKDEEIKALLRKFVIS